MGGYHSGNPNNDNLQMCISLTGNVAEFIGDWVFSEGAVISYMICREYRCE